MALSSALTLPSLPHRRITLRMDTHSMVAISLNTSEKLSPVIWHNKHLPFDACYTLPVPKPIGMCLRSCMCVSMTPPHPV